jgi:cellobiose phosphorylase
MDGEVTSSNFISTADEPIHSSGIVQSPLSSSDQASASVSASYFRFFSSSEEHGLYGWEQDSVQDELGKKLTVRTNPNNQSPSISC